MKKELPITLSLKEKKEDIYSHICIIKKYKPSTTLPAKYSFFKLKTNKFS